MPLSKIGFAWKLN